MCLFFIFEKSYVFHIEFFLLDFLNIVKINLIINFHNFEIITSAKFAKIAFKT